MKASDVSRAATSFISLFCALRARVRVHFIQTGGDGDRSLRQDKLALQVSPCGIREGSETRPNALFGAGGDFHHPSNVSIFVEDGVEGIHLLRPGGSWDPLGCFE